MRWAPLSGAADDRTFGGKTARLSAASAGGLPVPRAVAISVALTAAVAQAHPPGIEALEAAWSELDGPLAVRSSAVGEDGATASFAGLHHSVLNVVSFAELVAAIEGVWRSARSEPALAYRDRLAIRGAPEIGVLLQELVDPDVAGVMFTRDPAGAGQELLIEASWGLGGAVAAGRVVPDRYHLSASGAIVERTPGVKNVALRPAPAGGVAERPVQAEMAGRLCLGDSELVQLASLAARCESLFGGAQDVEWAIAAGSLHVLQVRPITRR